MKVPLSILPASVHPHPQDVLIIAFGMGTTFKTAVNLGLDVTTVELVPSVPKLMDYFHSDAKQILSNPKAKVVINDGRNYVFVTKDTYDLVVIDPPPPVNSAGTTVLYSTEFYKDIEKILRPNGLVTQWIYFSSRREDIQMIMKSFLDVYPYILVFNSPKKIGVYLIGSKQPITFGKEKFLKQFQNPAILKDLDQGERVKFTAEDIANLYLGDEKIIRNFTGPIFPVTDNFPRTEYFILRRLFHSSPRMKIDMLTANGQK